MVSVDLLRGDYVSAGLDMLGAVPFVGEAGDTAKLAKLGVEAAKDADNVIDAARAIKNADDVADTVKAAGKAEDLYTAAKVDGTIQAFLDASDNPIAEMSKMSGSIAKTSPIAIPEGAVIKPKVTNEGYYHMEYKWMADNGYEYKPRWHTRNPTAPLEQRDVWVIERKLPGIGAGSHHRRKIEQVWVGGDEWITLVEWKNAARANQLGIATEQQKRWLKMDITKLKNNKQYCAWWPEPEVILSLRENPEYNLHIWDGYFVAIFSEPIFTDKMWIGFTRDYQEDKGGWEKATEIENIDEYIWDMLRYKNRQFEWKETREVFDLIIDFLTYAKQTGQTVIVEVS